MKSRNKVGIVAGLIGLAITLLICLFAEIMYENVNKMDGLKTTHAELDIFFGALGAMGLVFFTGCIACGYFAAKQRDIRTKVDGLKVGSWSGFIFGFLTTLVPIFFINYNIVDFFLYVDGGLPSITLRIIRTGSRSIWMALILAIIGALLGVIGSFTVTPSSHLDKSSNIPGD